MEMEEEILQLDPNAKPGKVCFDSDYCTDLYVYNYIILRIQK